MVQPTNKGLFLELGIDDSSFKSGLTGINQQLKSAQTQFQSFAKIAEASGGSLEDLKNQTTAYQRVVDVQKKKVAELEKQFKEQQKAVEGNSEATQKDKDKLIRLANQYNQAKGNLAQYEKKLEGLNNKYKEASTVTEKTVSEYDKVNTELKLAKTAFDIVTASVDKNNKKTKELLNVANSFKQVVENQRKKVSLLKDEYDKIEKSVKNNANATEKDKDNLIKQGQAYSKALSELNNYEKKLEGLNKEYKATARSQSIFHKSLSTIDNGVKKALSSIDKLGKSVAEAGKKMTTLSVAGIGATLTTATNSAKDFADATTAIKVQTGASTKELKSMESSVKQAYTGTYAESAEQASDAVTKIYQNVGKLNQTDLNNVTNAMLTMEKNGSDMGENIRGVKNMMQAFGLSATEATDLLAKGFQTGLDKTGELGDNMAEYSSLWANMGFSANQTFDILQSGLQNGAYNLDKVNDAVKEMGLSLTDGRAEENIGQFSQKTQELFQLFKNNKTTASSVIMSMSNDINNMGANSYKAKELMSTMWSSLGEDCQKFIPKLGAVQGKYNNVKGAAKKMVDDNTTDFDRLKGAFRQVEVALVPVGQAIARALLPIANKIKELAEEFQKLPKAQQESIVKFAGIAVAVGPALIVLGKLISSISAITKGLFGGVKAVWTFGGKIVDFTKKAKNGESAIWNFTKKLGGIAGKGVKSTFSFIGDGFKSMGTVIKDAAGAVGKFGVKIKNIAVAGGKQALESLKSGFSSIKTIAMEAGTKVGEVSKKIIAFGSEKVKNGFNSVKTGLSNVKTKGKEASDKVAGITSKITAWTSDKVKLAFTSLKMNLSKVKEKAGEVSSKLSGIFTNIKAKGNGSFFSGLMSSLTGLISKSSFATKAMKGLSVAFSVMTGPVGIAVGAIALIGGAFVLAYKNCKPFRDFINRIGSWFKEKFDIAIKWTKDFGGRLKDWIVNKSINPISLTVKGWQIAKDFKGRFDKARKEGQSFSEAMKTASGEMLGNIVGKIKNWSVVKWFSEKWSNIKKTTSDFIEKMKKGISNMITDMVDSITNSKIGKAFSEAFNKAKELVAKPVNSIIHGANWVIHKLGGPETTIKDWDPNKYANGTPKGGHPGGLAMVNDEKGATYREAVTLPNGRTFIPNGRNVVMNLPKGTQVANAKTTRNALNSGILKYKDGTDESWLSKAWNFGKKAVSKIGDVIGDVMDYATNPGKLVRKVMENFVNFGKLLDFPLDLGKGILRKGVQALINKVKAMFESMESDDGGSFGGHGDLGSNKWFQIHGNWVREWQYRLLEPIIKQYHFRVTDGGRRTWDNYDHSKGRAMDIALPGNPLDIYWKVAQQIDKMPFVKYVNSNMKSTITGKWAPSNLEPRADHIHVSFTKEFLSAKELKASSGGDAGGQYNYKGSGGVMPRSEISKLVKRALKANGLPSNGAWYDMVMKRVYQESGGNPRAINLWDSNAKAGHPSKGLVQMIDSTFNAYKFPGHNNIYNPYDNLLSAINYMKKKYGLQGMIARAGIGYEKGGLVTTHQMAQIAEGNKPEMVIPLTNKSRSVQLINKARKLIGEDDIQTDTSELREQNRELKAMNEKLSSMIDLLGALLSKDNNIYMDGREFARIGAKPIQNEVNRMNINQNRLRGIG